MKWEQHVKKEILGMAKATAKASELSGFIFAYGTAEEFEAQHTATEKRKDEFFTELGKIDSLGRVSALARALFHAAFMKGASNLANMDRRVAAYVGTLDTLERYVQNVCNY